MVKSPRKTGYSSKSVTFDDLSGNFHLPINEVARKLGLCVTVLKQRCREYGIKRWPYRKVRKLDNLICTLESPLATGKPPAVASSLMVVTTPARASEADTVPMEGVGKLAVAKETRDFLLSNPNSTVHLSVGRVKVQRRRASSSVAGDEPPRCPTPGSGGGQLSGVGATSDRQLDTASSTSRGLLSESRKTSPGAWEEVSATNSVVWPQSRSLASSAGGNPRSSFVPRSLSSESGSAFRRIERVGSGGGRCQLALHRPIACPRPRPPSPRAPTPRPSASSLSRLACPPSPALASALRASPAPRPGMAPAPQPTAGCPPRPCPCTCLLRTCPCTCTPGRCTLRCACKPRSSTRLRRRPPSQCPPWASWASSPRSLPSAPQCGPLQDSPLACLLATQGSCRRRPNQRYLGNRIRQRPVRRNLKILAWGRLLTHAGAEA